MLKQSLRINIIFLFFLFVNIYPQNNVLTSYNIFNLHTVSETAVSPDGNLVAYTVIVPRPFTDEPGIDYKHLYIFNRLNDVSRGLITENVSVASIQWMPDSKSVLFLAKLGDSKTTQIYNISVNGGSTEKISDSEMKVERFEISPDGNKIAYVSSEPQFRKKKEIEKAGFDAEIFEEELLDLNLYMQDLDEDQTKKLTSNVTVHEFKWSPDSKQIAAAIAEKNLVDYSYMFKRICLIDPVNGSLTKIVENPGKLTEISWSPDGKHLAFVAGVDVNDPVSGSLFITEIPAVKTFAELRNYSKGFSGSVEKIKWKDENTILFSSEEGVDITLSQQRINDKERKLLIEPGEVVFSSFSYNNGVISLPGNTSLHPSELFIYNFTGSTLTKHTNLNAWLNDVRLAKQEKISYAARDGLEIEGVLVYPLNYEPGKKYPLINYIHGGPESAVNNGWVTQYNIWGQVAAAKDFFVFMPNYRASSGRGVEFAKMDFGDPVAAEFDDVLDGINYLVEKGFVDKSKVGIGGGSYGGYFSAWAATKETGHFAAAVVFVGVTNLISKRYTSDIPYELYHVHWGVWTHEDFDLMLDRSPIKYATQSKTPTLILHGKNDTRVHPSQSMELYRAMKTHAKAPVRLVWYPGQGHGNTKNTARLDYNLRTMEWFEYYLKSSKPKDQLPDKYLEYEEAEVLN